MGGHIGVPGRLGADAEVKTLPSGVRVMEFRIACDGWDGKAKYTEWYNCSFWQEKKIDAIEQYMKKGKQVFVTGLHRTELYTKKSGEVVAKNKVRVGEVVLMGGGEVEDKGGSRTTSSKPKYQPPAQREPPDEDLDDLIPF
jgi:single-strand DNA-binding protein